MTADKAEIRRTMRRRRKEVPAAERATVSRAICERLLARADVRRAMAERAPIAVYLASPDEIDLADFIRSALACGAALVAPRWNGATYELASLVSLDLLVPGPHGILEPPAPLPMSQCLERPMRQLDEPPAANRSSPIPRPPSLVPHPSSPIPHPSSLIPSVWLVPGLAFTRGGKRIGYGGGWYDRLLADAAPGSVRLGVAYDFQVLDDLPSEAHDVPLTGVV